MSLNHRSEFCIGCRACQQACQDYYNLPAGKRLIEIVEKEELSHGILSVTYIMYTCRQCESAFCMEACNLNAIRRNEHDVVIIDEEKCVGCGRCEKVCPFHSIVLLQKGEGKRPLKCMECLERMNGKSICQEACPLFCIEKK